MDGINKVNIINFGNSGWKYFPMFECFLSEALHQHTDLDSEIITILKNEPLEKYVNELARQQDSLVLVWETLAAKSVRYMERFVEFPRLLKEKCDLPLYFGGYWATTLGKKFDEFQVYDGIVNGFNPESIVHGVIDAAQTPTNPTNDGTSINALERLSWDEYELRVNDIRAPEKYVTENTLRGYLSTFGCPFDCSFCYNNVLNEKGVKYINRSVEKVKEDFRKIDEICRFSQVEFKDLNFFENSNRAIKILKWLYDDFGKDTRHQMDITVSNTSPELIKKLGELGVENLYIGLESFSEETREKYNKFYDNETLYELFEAGDRYDVNVKGNIIIGAEWQTKENVQYLIDEAIRCMNKYRNLYITFNALRPVPGTDSYQQLFPDLTEKYDYFEFVDIIDYKVGDKQNELYGDSFDFIDIERTHYLMKTIKRTKMFENNIKDQWSVSLLGDFFSLPFTLIRKILEIELKKLRYDQHWLQFLYSDDFTEKFIHFTKYHTPYRLLIH